MSERKRKILQINVVANWGSTGRIVEEIGIEAMNNNWESYVAYGQGKPTSKSELIRVGNKKDLCLHLLNTRLFDKHGLCSTDATRKLVKRIKEIHPDIIHLHNIHGYYLNYQLLFSFLKESNIPVIWTIHDCWPITGHCAYFSYANCNKWKEQCGNCPQKDTYPATKFLDRSKLNFCQKKESFSHVRNMTIVPVSDWLKGILSQSFLGKEYNIHRIYNGINTDVFHPYPNTEEIRRNNGITSKIMLLAAATMWSQRKGLKDIIALSRMLDESFTIVVVGVNNSIKKQLPNNIIGIERTENVHKMAELYSAADIVLNLSYEETFGLTTAEGLACGTPGIVYNATASPELINDSVGRIVQPGNLSEVREAIMSIISHPKDEAVINACRRHALSRFNKLDRYKEYIELYNSIIDKSIKR